jgi:hypothetical protein
LNPQIYLGKLLQRVKALKKIYNTPKFTPLEKRFIKIYLLLAVFYSIVSVYLLNTPIDEWVFNLGQYNNLNHQIYLGKLLQREKTQKKIYNTPLNIFF